MEQPVSVEGPRRHWQRPTRLQCVYIVTTMAVCLSALFVGRRARGRCRCESEFAACERELDAVCSLKERLGGSITLMTQGIGIQPDVRSYDPIREAEIRDAEINQHIWSDLRVFQYVGSLTITNCRFVPGTRVDFASFSYLWTLTVCDTPLKVDAIRSLRDVSRLRYLCIVDAGAKSEWLPWIGKLQGLEGLEVYGITVYSDRDVGHLAALTRLSSLALQGLPITLKSAGIIAKLENVKYLELAKAKITIGSLRQLTGLKTLRALHLDGSDLSDADTLVFSKFPNLLFLSLSGTHITDKGLESLSRARGLYQLDLSGTDVTAAALRRFLDAMPKTLHWDADNTRLSEEELRKLHKDFPGKRDRKLELELGYFG
jgi:internalin A